MDEKEYYDISELSDVRDESDQLVVYVDGSYDHSIKRYAYGCVYLTPEGELYTEYGGDSKEEVAASRNVSGEMLGSMHAVKWCIEKGYKSIKICYDYAGIEMWATGGWKTKNPLTRMYAEYMKRQMTRVKVTFQKVTAHTGNKYNELADKLAKEGLLGNSEDK